MLVQFSVRNFKTFKDEAKLTLFASNYDKTTHERDNVFEVPKFGLRLLKSAVIYGANASGKTKLVDAAHFMKHFILESSKESQQGEPIEVEPFRLNTGTVGEPSLFEVVFVHKDELFRYGFEATAEVIAREWLYHRPNTKEVEIFFREGQEFSVHPRLFRKGNLFVKENMVRTNALMLSVAAQFNDELAFRVFEWFSKFRPLFGLFEEDFMSESIDGANNELLKQRMLTLLRNADIGIEDIEVHPVETLEVLDEMPKFFQVFMTKAIQAIGMDGLSEVKTRHRVFNEEGVPVGLEVFQLSEQESAGTLKFFALTGPIIQALDNGEILFVDELDSKIHPNLVHKLVGLFNSAITNPKNAQLIFNTHDSNLLGANMFRRDQIWFVEKDRFGAASLYSLASFKADEVRKNDNFEENYLHGRYGGVPILGDFQALFIPESAGAK